LSIATSASSVVSQSSNETVSLPSLPKANAPILFPSTSTCSATNEDVNVQNNDLVGSSKRNENNNNAIFTDTTTQSFDGPESSSNNALSLLLGLCEVNLLSNSVQGIQEILQRGELSQGQKNELLRRFMEKNSPQGKNL